MFTIGIARVIAFGLGEKKSIKQEPCEFQWEMF